MVYATISKDWYGYKIWIEIIHPGNKKKMDPRSSPTAAGSQKVRPLLPKVLSMSSIVDAISTHFVWAIGDGQGFIAGLLL
ncbi:hypothetical protein FRC0190_00228 [Corynebacterium rouxii]|uniref:Uncharacterized protein n=1 Tax=Corynebacterium rouxii TaxID=2719119 RepID=A0A6I8MFR0_9CORY|nr:hypothetical protein FRC0190_00228 [Corynebacterium rouxii]